MLHFIIEPAIASACLTIIFVISKLAGVSIGSIFGTGALGALTIVVTIFGALVASFFAFPIAWLLKLLLDSFIPNREVTSLILGTLGLCAVLVGHIKRDSEWSSLLIVVGFLIGCFAGAEYQKAKGTKKSSV